MTALLSAMLTAWSDISCHQHDPVLPLLFLVNNLDNLEKMKNFMSWIQPTLLKSKVPRDGTRRYLYDIWLPLAILITTFLFTLIFYTTYKADSSTKPGVFFVCNDDGYLETTRHNFNPLWDPQLYFTINLASGKFPFSTVKVIDAAWDVVVGRGGQAVAALIAYRTLRRSLTLTMETYTLAIPTVTSLYCQQIQVFPVMQMTHNLFRSWGSLNRPASRKPKFPGRLRLATQIFTCVYVLLFATLASVMTGYRAQLTGLLAAGEQLVPISDLVIPRLILYDGDRFGLPNPQLVTVDEIYYPSNAKETSNYEAVFDAKEFIESSQNFKEPYGTLVDYYLTCVAVRRSFVGSNMTPPAYELSCGAHNCSCSVPTRGPSGAINTAKMNMTGRIVLNNSSWEHASFLDIDFIPGGFTFWRHDNDGNEIPDSALHDLSNAIDFWAGQTLAVSRIEDQSRIVSAYMYGDFSYNTSTIQNEGRCVVEDAYSWGFSSLLLLTFCLFTMLFALALILLQTDVYWHSKHDRDHQSHSIYTDVLFLAEELKAAFGDDIKDNIRSPKLLREKIECTEKGVRLQVSTLPLSRSEEASPYQPVIPPERRVIQRKGIWVFVPHSETTQVHGQSIELETVDHTSAVSSALSLQPEVVDTNLQESGHGR